MPDYFRHSIGNYYVLTSLVNLKALAWIVFNFFTFLLRLAGPVTLWRAFLSLFNNSTHKTLALMKPNKSLDKESKTSIEDGRVSSKSK